MDVLKSTNSQFWVCVALIITSIICIRTLQAIKKFNNTATSSVTMEMKEPTAL